MINMTLRKLLAIYYRLAQPNASEGINNVDVWGCVKAQLDGKDLELSDSRYSLNLFRYVGCWSLRRRHAEMSSKRDAELKPNFNCLERPECT